MRHCPTLHASGSLHVLGQFSCCCCCFGLFHLYVTFTWQFSEADRRQGIWHATVSPGWNLTRGVCVLALLPSGFPSRFWVMQCCHVSEPARCEPCLFSPNIVILVNLHIALATRTLCSHCNHGVKTIPCRLLMAKKMSKHDGCEARSEVVNYFNANTTFIRDPD